MTPEDRELFNQRVHAILAEHPEGMTEAAIVREMERRGFITPAMRDEWALEEGLRRIYYIVQRKALWTEVSPRQIRRQRRRPPFVRTGVLCDRDGRKLCTVMQDATGEYLFPGNIEDYARQMFDAYPDCPEDYQRP
jgi:hypothetical protein